jgi:hypothetical protein
LDVPVEPFFKDAVPQAVQPAEQSATFSSQTFFDVIYHQLPDMAFMTFRVSETLRVTGEQREQRGIEAYTFKDGKIASKDVYRKPILT